MRIHHIPPRIRTLVANNSECRDVPGYSTLRFVCAVLFFFVLMPPSSSFSQELTFTPSLYSTHSALELNMSQQMTEYRQGDQTTKSSARAWGEKINFSTAGFVYHPRFFLFQADLSESLNQARVANSDTQSGTTTDYELRTRLLPSHPYNLELFTLRHSSAPKATFLQGPADTFVQSGALFRYQDRPFSFSSSYHANNINSTVNTVTTRSYRANAGYSGAMTSSSANYSLTDSTSSRGRHATNEGYGFSNGIRLSDLSLNSAVRRSENDQASPFSPASQGSILTWTEHLTVPLPLRFSARASYEYQDEIARTAAAESNPAQERFSRSSSRSFHLSHRLYQSLNTQYSLNELSAKTSLGESSSRSESIGSTYTKTIPAAVLSAGVQFSRTDAERLGTPLILNEAHSAALYGSFLLLQQNIIESTIVLQVKDPATETLMTMPLTNYQVDRLGNNVQITIQDVAPATMQTDPFYSYEFLVTYSLSDQSKLSMDTQGYSLRLDFLDNLLGAYYAYTTSNQELVSGSLPGGPDRISGETVGMACRVNEYTGSLERQRTSSSSNPSESRKAELGFRTPYSENTNMSVRLSYSLMNYFPAPGGAAVGSQQKIIGTNVTMDKKFPEKKLSLFATGAYSIVRSTIHSDILSLNAYLTWQIGVLSVNTGAQVSRSTSQTSTGTGSLVSQSVYATLSRTLF